MRNTITIAAFRRPDYLKQVLDSLTVALRFCPEFSPHVIVVGVDQFADGSRREDVLDVIREFGHQRLEVIEWNERLGINEHPRRLCMYAFSKLESDFNLHLEDDTVLSPDALSLAQWFFDGHSARRVLNLYSPSLTYDSPDELRLGSGFHAWGWGCNFNVWEKLSLHWNHRISYPIGWDWSVTDTMDLYGFATVHPVLSRVRNIGRLNGWHQTPEGYDRDFAGQVAAGNWDACKKWRLVTK